jgi:hypothetical protein
MTDINVSLTNEERALILLVLGYEKMKAEYKFDLDRRKVITNLLIKLKEAN